MNSTANRRKHQRFIKRLTTTFFVDHNRFTGISSDISAGGLFIRTNRGFPLNTPVNIEILLPNNKVSALKGIVRRTLRTSITAKKNGMGIEIIETDTPFTDFLKSLVERTEANTEGNIASPELQTLSCIHYGIEQNTITYPEQERRRHKRLKTEHMKLKSEMPSAREVKVINISISGVLIRADRRLDISHTYVLKIGYKDKTVFTKVAVSWACLVESTKDSHGNITPFYIAGMQFTESANKTLEDIINFINHDAQADVMQMNTPGTNHPPSPCFNHDNLSERESLKEASGKLPDMEYAKSVIETEAAYTPEFIKEIEDIYIKHKKNSLSYYDILNISTSADTNEIKKAYYKRAREFHPDRHSNLPPDIKEKLTSLSAYLNEASWVLLNSEDRIEYDMSFLSKKHVVVSNKELAYQEFEQGKIEFWNGNLPMAETLFQKSLYFDDSSGKYFYFYAKTLLKIGKLQEAEKAIREAIKIDPSNADYLVEAGYIYHAMNLSHRAKEIFEMALRTEPANIKALEGIAGLKRKNGINSLRYTIYNPIKALKKTLAG